MKMLLKHLKAQGVSVLNLPDIEDSERALVETRAAMESGAAAIAQATMVHGRWFGRSDVLRRVELPSKLGDWSYEVYDCKLACETKAATILQLSLYSELLESIQGILPESLYVVPPGVDFSRSNIEGSISRSREEMASVLSPPYVSPNEARPAGSHNVKARTFAPWLTLSTSVWARYFRHLTVTCWTLGLKTLSPRHLPGWKRISPKAGFA